MVLSVAAAALLFPVLVFIGAATRLSAARREQRFAAMRLVGATPRQIATIATVESSVAAIAGTEGDPASAVQRMIWRLRDGGQTWTRQTMTIQPDGTKETMLVFRKRSTKKP